MRAIAKCCVKPIIGLKAIAKSIYKKDIGYLAQCPFLNICYILMRIFVIINLYPPQKKSTTICAEKILRNMLKGYTVE